MCLQSFPQRLSGNANMSADPAFQLSKDYTATIYFSVHQCGMVKNLTITALFIHCKWLHPILFFQLIMDYSQIRWTHCLLRADSPLTGTHVCELPRPCQRKGCTNMHFSFLPSRLLLYPQAPSEALEICRNALAACPGAALRGWGRGRLGAGALDSGMHFLLEVRRPNLCGL